MSLRADPPSNAMQHPRILRAVLALVLPFLLSASVAAGVPNRATPLQQDAPLRYARVTGKAVKIRNLADPQGSVVAAPQDGSLVAVYRERGDWLEVEVPGGFAVWVFGSYLKETDVEDVLEVTRNGVNMRPAPERKVTNYPLGQRLFAGDRVRVIEREDPAKPITEDWVRIWSPAGARAWMAKADSRDLPAGVNGATAWKEALAALPPAPARAKSAQESRAQSKLNDPVKPTGIAKPTGTPAEASAETAEAAADFESTLQAAWDLLAAERTKPSPDFGALEAAFGAARKAAPDGASAVRAGQGLDAVAALREANALRAELEAERQRRQAEALRRQKEIWEESRAKDPLGGVFLSRGALERVVEADAEPRYFLRFGGEVASELVCVSGRYDLDQYTGYEIGVKGMDLRLPESRGSQPLRIEVTRIEVLSRR